LGGVLFPAKAEPAKTGPAIDWSEIEARLHEISAPVRAGDLRADTSIPIEAAAALAHDPASLDEPPFVFATARLDNLPGDPRDMRFSQSEAVVSLAPHQDIFTEFPRFPID